MNRRLFPFSAKLDEKSWQNNSVGAKCAAVQITRFTIPSKKELHYKNYTKWTDDFKASVSGIYSDQDPGDKSLCKLDFSGWSLSSYWIFGSPWGTHDSLFYKVRLADPIKQRFWACQELLMFYMPAGDIRERTPPPIIYSRIRSKE